MNPTQCIWQNGQMIPWEQASVHLLTHALHYGSGVFEGIRFFETAQGPAIFKLSDHIERLFYSAGALGMKVLYSKQGIHDALVKTVAVNGLTQGYVRPLIYYGCGSMQVAPEETMPVDVAIACWRWDRYLSADAVDVKVSDYVKINPRSTVRNAKICGHYINGLLAGLAIRGTQFHEVLLLDEAGYVTEGSAENIFIVKNGRLLTTPAGAIIEGITRSVIIEFADELGLEVEETRFTPEAVIDADEAFLCGTAAGITPIRSLDERLVAEGQPGPITQAIQATYQRIIRGDHPGFLDALTWVVPTVNKCYPEPLS